MIDKIIMIRSRSDRYHIGVDGRVIVLIPAIMLPIQLTILGPFESFDITVGISCRMIDV